MQSLWHVLAILPEKSPSTVINVITPLTAMQDAGLITTTIRLQNEVTPLEVAQADAIVLCRNWHPVYRSIFELALRLHIPIIYDLDDNVLAAPRGTYTYEMFQSPGRRDMFEWLLRSAALVRVHSPLLRQSISEYNPNTQQVWSAVNWSLVPPELPALSMNPLHIVYTAQHEIGKPMYVYMQQDLHALLEKYESRVRLHFLGYNPPDLCGHPLVTCQPFEGDYTKFFTQFTRSGYAIGLAPMIDGLLYSSKTNMRFRDYAAAGAAGIYADTPLYRGNGVIDGETGLLVSGEPGTWLPALTRLIENPALIEAIRQQAYQSVKARYNFEIVTQMWLENLQSLPPRLTLSKAEMASLARLRWSFTHIRKPDATWVALLRNILRDIVPLPWKLRYYDTYYALRKRFRL